MLRVEGMVDLIVQLCDWLLFISENLSFPLDRDRCTFGRLLAPYSIQLILTTIIINHQISSLLPKLQGADHVRRLHHWFNYSQVIYSLFLSGLHGSYEQSWRFWLLCSIQCVGLRQSQHQRVGHELMNPFHMRFDT